MEDISHATWQGLFLALNGTSLLGERTPRMHSIRQTTDYRGQALTARLWSGFLALQRANVKLTHYRGRRDDVAAGSPADSTRRGSRDGSDC